MKRTLLALMTLLAINAFAQNEPTERAKPIVEEGKRLYRSEMASWYGTDLFLEKYKDGANIGGYFSYDDKGVEKCIFFSKGDKPKVIGTISFDSTFNTKTANTDLTERELTSGESDIYAIRKIALAAINSDTLFKRYNNTSFNLIPMIHGGEKKVYVLTGPQQTGVVIFGNDYLLTFDNGNNLTNRKQLHRNIISISYGKEKDGTVVEGAMHSHLPETGDFITATDICTLMLYEKIAKWKQYNVVSKDYLSIWNCKTDDLIVLPMSVVDKINKDQKERRSSRSQKSPGLHDLHN
jgi:hypothetical protein